MSAQIDAFKTSGLSPPEDRIPLNGCSPCGEDFASVEAFDRHRIGNAHFRYAPNGPTMSEALGPYETISEWYDAFGAGKRPKVYPLPASCEGRRCMDAEEMLAAGLEQRENGRWGIPVTDAKRESLTRLRGRTKLTDATRGIGRGI